jgi:hypothetical protein
MLCFFGEMHPPPPPPTPFLLCLASQAFAFLRTVVLGVPYKQAFADAYSVALRLCRTHSIPVMAAWNDASLAGTALHWWLSASEAVWGCQGR